MFVGMCHGLMDSDSQLITSDSASASSINWRMWNATKVSMNDGESEEEPRRARVPGRVGK